MSNWNKKLSDVDFLNTGEKLKKASVSDSIFSVNLNFQRNRQINNLLAVGVSNNPVGVINKRLFIESRTNGAIDDFSKPIRDYSEIFELVDVNSNLHGTILNSLKLKDVIPHFYKKRINIFDGRTYYPESLIVVDSNDKLYSIISYKDILKQIGMDTELCAMFTNIKEATIDESKSIYVANNGKDLLSVSRESTYDKVGDLFMKGLRTVPVMKNNKLDGFMLSHIFDSNDTSKVIDEKYIFHADSFKHTWLKFTDPLPTIVQAYRSQPYFSSLAIFTNDKDFEGILSYTELFKWCYQNIK